MIYREIVQVPRASLSCGATSPPARRSSFPDSVQLDSSIGSDIESVRSGASETNDTEMKVDSTDDESLTGLYYKLTITAIDGVLHSTELFDNEEFAPELYNMVSVLSHDLDPDSFYIQSAGKNVPREGFVCARGFPPDSTFLVRGRLAASSSNYCQIRCLDNSSLSSKHGKAKPGELELLYEDTCAVPSKDKSP